MIYDISMQVQVEIIEGDEMPGADVVKKERVQAEDEKYQPVQIGTERGRIDCHYYEVRGATKGVVMVGGVGGGFDTPAKGLYPRLCEYLKEPGICSLRVKFRFPTDMAEATFDTVAGMNFLKSRGIRSIGLIGHSFGGAVIIRAAANDPAVRTVVTLSTQSYGIDPVVRFKNGTSILLIHGKEDKVLPFRSSVYTYHLAYEPKKLVLYEGAGHVLDEVADEVYEEVKNWILANLK